MAVTQPAVPAPRRRRWLLVVGIIGVVLVAYAFTLTWATQRLENDIQKSIRPLPAAEEVQQRRAE